MSRQKRPYAKPDISAYLINMPIRICKSLQQGVEQTFETEPDRSQSLREPIRARLLMSEYGSYFDGLSQRLSADGFTVKRAVGLDPYQLDVVAAKSAFEISKFGKMTRFILGAGMESVTAQTVEDFSSRATKYALDNRNSLLPRGFGGSMLSVPVIVSEDFSEDLKEWISNTLPQKHWAAFEFPVLVSVNNRQIHYCKKTPIWGAAYYGGFRKFVEERLRF